MDHWCERKREEEIVKEIETKDREKEKWGSAKRTNRYTYTYTYKYKDTYKYTNFLGSCVPDTCVMCNEKQTTSVQTTFPFPASFTHGSHKGNCTQKFWS